MQNRTVKIATHPDLMNGCEVADYIGVNEKSLQRWAREGRGPLRARLGNRCYYSRANVDAWLKQHINENGRGDSI